MANQDTSPYKYNTQLHMYRPDVPLAPVQIPEGYTLRSARLEDGPQWCHCCRDGYLSVEEESQELFEKNMLNDPAHVTLDHIYVLENPEHQIVATATAMLTDDPTHGKLHMVANPVEFRGHGFSKVVCWAVVDTLQKLGRTTSSLSTDDFRLGAIKTYLRLGYLPVLNREDMEARWLDVMKALGYSSLKTMLHTDGVYSEGPALTL